MSNTLILTVIGPDRPGIVDDLSTLITKNGGNWLESRMCNLAGQFAGVLQIECAEQKNAGFIEALNDLEKNGLKIQVEQGVKISDALMRANIELEITGPDHPGIVQDISHFLATRDINIVELASRCEEGAMSGGYVFSSNIIASIPKSQEISDVENALGDLANKLNVDITMDDLKGTRTRI